MSLIAGMLMVTSTQAEKGKNGHDDHHEADQINDPVHCALLVDAVSSQQSAAPDLVA
jgi:lysozyme family protein